MKAFAAQLRAARWLKPRHRPVKIKNLNPIRLLRALIGYVCRVVMPKPPKAQVPYIKQADVWEMEIIMSDGRIVTRTIGGKKTYEAAWEFGESLTAPHGHQLTGIRRE